MSAFLLLMLYIGCAQSMVNLFINRAEMRRILGKNTELYYVANGSVNEKEVSAPLKINANITHVLFSWKTTLLRQKVFYEIHAKSSDSTLIPLINIPSSAQLSFTTSRFKVEYRCAGIKSGFFDAQLHIRIWWQPYNNQIRLTLIQRKNCASRDVRQAFDNFIDYDPSDSDGSGADAPFPTAYTILIALALFSLVVLVIALILIGYHRSATKNFTSLTVGNQKLKTVTGSSSFRSIRPGFAHRASFFKFAENLKLKFGDALATLYANRSLFQMYPVEELDGKHSELRCAIWKQNLEGVAGDVDDEEDNACYEERVITKTLNLNADRKILLNFLQQSLAFHQVPAHDNLAQVVAIASYGRLDDLRNMVDYPLICYRHSGFGNLKKFLLSFGSEGPEAMQQSSSAQKLQTVSCTEVISMSLQILSAISHLHKFGIIHTDIATRNCFVGQTHPGRSRLFVQLCDSALSYDFFPDDYHRIGGKFKPIKWMAPESLQTKLFNTCTDVWSFGVTMWELFTCAQQPYASCRPNELELLLERGDRLKQPSNCPDDIFGLMYCCWQLNPKDRPTCEQLMLALQDFVAQDRR